MEDLRATADVRMATTPEAVSDVFTSNDWPKVLVIDEGLVQDKYWLQRRQAISWVQNGGTLIFGLRFSSSAHFGQQDSLFSDFGLPWKTASYHGNTFNLNQNMTQISHSGLLKQYNCKPLHLAGVSNIDALYLPSGPSHVQTAAEIGMFGTAPPEDLSETPAAFGKVGRTRGWVGYVGDANEGQGTKQVILAMMGLNV